MGVPLRLEPPSRETSRTKGRTTGVLQIKIYYYIHSNETFNTGTDFDGFRSASEVRVFTRGKSTTK